MHRTCDRRSDADLHHAAGIDQALLDGVEKDGAVAKRLAEVGAPGVDMGVEMDDAERPSLLLGRGAQQRQRDAVVAAESDKVADRGRLLLDQLEARRDVAEGDGEIADVGQRQRRRRVETPEGMVAVDQHAARPADGRGAEAGAGAICGADVEGNAGDAERRIRVVAPDGEEGWRQGESGRFGHRGHSNRKTAAATAQVQRPAASPSAAAVCDVLPMMSWLVS